jgi:hypothetical protein
MSRFATIEKSKVLIATLLLIVFFNKKQERIPEQAAICCVNKDNVKTKFWHSFQNLDSLM